MNIGKDQILQFLKDKGQNDQADQAAGELPDQVDTDQHAGLLSKFGIDPKALLGKLGGSLPGGLGNLFYPTPPQRHQHAPADQPIWPASETQQCWRPTSSRQW